MRSIFFGFAAVAFAAEDCQVADEGTMLQIGRNTMRKIKTAGSKDAKAILKDMREIANSLVEGSDSTTSQDDVTDSLDAAHAALTELRQATLQQIANAQQQITDASGGFQSCTNAEATGLQLSVNQRAAAVESCQITLDQLRTAETQQCNTAEDCLCDEARVRTTDQEALCTAMTETYEAVFCNHHQMCTSSQQCHSRQAEVYQRLTADVEAEMALIEEEYIAVEQSMCLNRLSKEAMTPPRTRISRADRDACDDVDVSALAIRYPTVTTPPACGDDIPACGNYHLGVRGRGTTCTTESVSEDDCLRVVRALEPEGQVQGRRHLLVGSNWRHVPPGCSVQQRPDWAAVYNRYLGRNNGAYTPVCTGPGHE